MVRFRAVPAAAKLYGEVAVGGGDALYAQQWRAHWDAQDVGGGGGRRQGPDFFFRATHGPAEHGFKHALNLARQGSGRSTVQPF